jgi:hypothetical protein
VTEREEWVLQDELLGEEALGEYQEKGEAL